jgi:hypothetical protein
MDNNLNRLCLVVQECRSAHRTQALWQHPLVSMLSPEEADNTLFDEISAALPLTAIILPLPKCAPQSSPLPKRIFPLGW